MCIEKLWKDKSKIKHTKTNNKIPPQKKLVRAAASKKNSKGNGESGTEKWLFIVFPIALFESNTLKKVTAGLPWWGSG